MPAKSNRETKPGYSIGAVSKITGIHPETLRMWERRYGLVKPGRSSGKSRRYSDEDVRRLSLVKTLVDAGNQISTIAPLSMDQLQQRLEASSPRILSSGTEESRPCRIIVVGNALPAKLASGAGTSRPDVAATFEDEDAMTRAGKLPEVDALVIESASVQAETLGSVRRLLALCGARRAVVVYGFGTRQALRDLDSAGVACLRTPVEAAEIEAACAMPRAPMQSRQAGDETIAPGKVPPRLLTPQQLVRISTRSPVLACECPHHLVELINSMAAFETYSLECQHKNAEDAQIHAHLHSTAGRARAMLETALLRVAQFEGIDVS